MLNIRGGINRGPAVHDIGGVNLSGGIFFRQNDLGFVACQIGALLQTKCLIKAAGFYLNAVKSQMTGLEGFILELVMTQSRICRHADFINDINQIR